VTPPTGISEGKTSIRAYFLNPESAGIPWGREL
jgi:hypothetical protein